LPPLTPTDVPTPLWRLILDVSLFGVLGIVLLIVGYYIWEAITPYNNRRELHENKNLAVAVVVAALIIGMAMVISAAILRVG
jgi:putative membrane protein